MNPFVRFVAALAAAAASPALAQDQFVHADRGADSIFRTRDIDRDGVIDEKEVFLFFSGANAAGTPGLATPNAIAASVCRVVAVGDSVNRNITLLRDLNADGDAQDIGESRIFADNTNLSGATFGFISGVAFDAQCRLHVVNAGNANGPDMIYRVVDLDADGDALDAGEITQYVGDAPGGFGPGNGAFSPQEIYFDADNVGWLRDSSGDMHGIWRFDDINGNGRADDSNVDGLGTNEFTLFFGEGNASGITVSAGFAIAPDRVRPGAIYMLQIATGSVEQLYRVQDLNNDGDAQDAGEALLVWEDASASFNVNDLVSLANGDVLVAQSTTGFVHRLRDDNFDGDFLDAGERTLMVTNAAGVMLDVRQFAALCRLGDVNCSGAVDVDDLIAIILGWGPAGACSGVDTDCDNDVDVDDLIAVILNWG